MIQAKNSINSQYHFQFHENLVKYNGFEFELLLLAMLTGLNCILTERQSIQNMRSLMIRLELSTKNLSPKTRSAISFLLSNELVIRKDHGYLPSKRGKSFGTYLLSFLQKNLSTP